MRDSLVAVAGLLVLAVGVATAPIPELGFVLQGTGVGALIGAVVAQRAKTRNPERDAGEIVVHWTLFVGFLFCLIALVDLATGGVR
jgi:hypothetical protein